MWLDKRSDHIRGCAINNKSDWNVQLWSWDCLCRHVQRVVCPWSKKIHTILSDHYFSAEIIYVLINIPQNRLWKIKTTKHIRFMINNNIDFALYRPNQNILVKPTQVVTSIKQTPVSKGHIFLTYHRKFNLNLSSFYKKSCLKRPLLLCPQGVLLIQAWLRNLVTRLVLLKWILQNKIPIFTKDNYT